MCHIHRESFKSLKRSVAFDDHLCMIVDAYLIANTDVTSLWDYSPLRTESLLSTIAIQTICMHFIYCTYLCTLT